MLLSDIFTKSKNLSIDIKICGTIGQNDQIFVKGTVQPFERWFLRRISALLIEKTN
jgi:hypothetical protein